MWLHVGDHGDGVGGGYLIKRREEVWLNIGAVILYSVFCVLTVGGMVLVSRSM